MNQLTIGAPISGPVARFFGLTRDLSMALAADADVRDRADRVASLASAAHEELIGLAADLRSIERQIRQGNLF